MFETFSTMLNPARIPSLLNTNSSQMMNQSSIVAGGTSRGVSNIDLEERNPNMRDVANNDGYLSRLSFEAMTLIFVLLCYWVVYRMLIVYSVPRLSSFILSKLSRVCSLIFHVCIRMGSKKYWIESDRIGSNIINRYKLKLIDGHCCLKPFYKVIIYLTNLFESESSIKQWQQRISIDLVCESLIAMGSSVIVGITLISAKTKFYSTGYDENWVLAIKYNIVSGCLEIVYISLMFIWYRKCANISLIEPFLRFYQFNGWTFVFYFSVLFAIAGYLIPTNALIDSAKIG